MVCVLMFCATGGRCSVPLHTFLTDYIEASGGSSELITLLNRLGAVASSETFDRHILRVSAQRKQECLLKDLPSDSLTIATTDIIDFLQSHASVYSGSQHRSWHATSVQIVQPQQSLITIPFQLNSEVARMDMTSPGPSNLAPVPTSQYSATDRGHHEALHSNQGQRTSSNYSPSKPCRSPAPKCVKRATTIKEAILLGEMYMYENRPDALHVGSRHTISMGCLQLEDFLQSNEEVAALDKLKKSFFTYVLHESALKPEHLLFSFKDFVAT